MIDFLSLILSHLLMLVVAFRVVMHPDLNTEPSPYARRFKHVGKTSNNKGAKMGNKLGA